MLYTLPLFCAHPLSAEMGFVKKGETALEGVSVIMYDGAGTRLDIGEEVGVETPMNRWKDGSILEVFSSFFCLFHRYLTVCDS